MGHTGLSLLVALVIVLTFTTTTVFAASKTEMSISKTQSNITPGPLSASELQMCSPLHPELRQIIARQQDVDYDKYNRGERGHHENWRHHDKWRHYHQTAPPARDVTEPITWKVIAAVALIAVIMVGGGIAMASSGT